MAMGVRTDVSAGMYPSVTLLLVPAPVKLVLRAQPVTTPALTVPTDWGVLSPVNALPVARGHATPSADHVTAMRCGQENSVMVRTG